MFVDEYDPNLYNCAKNWAPLPKIGGPKPSKFGANFGQLPNLIASISGTEQHIIERYTALQTAVSAVAAALCGGCLPAAG